MSRFYVVADVVLRYSGPKNWERRLPIQRKTETWVTRHRENRAVSLYFYVPIIRGNRWNGQHISAESSPLVRSTQFEIFPIRNRVLHGNFLSFSLALFTLFSFREPLTRTLWSGLAFRARGRFFREWDDRESSSGKFSCYDSCFKNPLIITKNIVRLESSHFDWIWLLSPKIRVVSDRRGSVPISYSVTLRFWPVLCEKRLLSQCWWRTINLIGLSQSADHHWPDDSEKMDHYFPRSQ
jgi:hypothetical protein